MPAVRMKHDEHGWTHAYSDLERIELEKSGWVVEVPEPKPEPKPAEPEKRKPGRPKGK